MSEPASAKNGDDAIGVLHHLSSSGGTLIARAIAAMPDVVMLSEVHPLAPHRIWFAPFDPVPQLLATIQRSDPTRRRRRRSSDVVSILCGRDAARPTGV